MQLILVADFPELFFRAGKVFHEGLVSMHAGNRGSSGAALLDDLAYGKMGQFARRLLEEADCEAA